MSIETGIEYADSTGNLQMGCDGCELFNRQKNLTKCYAARLTDSYGGRKGWPSRFEEPVIFPERVKSITGMSDLMGKDRPNKPWLNGYPRIIFLNDMGDQHTAKLPVDWLAKFLPELEASPHIYLMLTKRPSTAVKFWRKMGRIPPNIWVGTSITNPASRKRAEIIAELEGMASVLWLSFEPYMAQTRLEDEILRKFKWCVTGGDSDGENTALSHPAWYEELRQQCDTLGVKFFFKQWGAVCPSRLIVHNPDYRFALHIDGRVSSNWEALQGMDGWEVMVRVSSDRPNPPALLGGVAYHAMPEHKPHGQLNLFGGML